jgi:hypothetical protein
MLMDIWIISVLILAVTFVFRGGDISEKIMIKSIFPTTFANNWYMTCYLLFYAIHPFLNRIINQITQRTMLRCTLLLTFLYIGCNYVRKGVFLSSSLILWVTIYFLIAYMKLYLKDISNNVKCNIVVLLIGFVGNYGLITLTNILGLHISLFQNHVQHWNNESSPFMILMVIGLLNIARNLHFKNAVVNYISKLSMLIYIVHENIILRTYYRPLMWQFVYRNFGYDRILLWTFVLVLIVFVFVGAAKKYNLCDMPRHLPGHRESFIC